MKLIYQLSTPKKPVVGWMTSLPMAGGFNPQTGERSESPVMYTQAQELFNLKPIATTATSIDADVDVLVLVHPEGALAGHAVRDRSVRDARRAHPHVRGPGGGSGHARARIRRTRWRPWLANKSSDSGPLLKAWGVDFNPQEVIGDSRACAAGGDAPG